MKFDLNIDYRCYEKKARLFTVCAWYNYDRKPGPLDAGACSRLLRQ